MTPKVYSLLLIIALLTQIARAAHAEAPFLYGQPVEPELSDVEFPSAGGNKLPKSLLSLYVGPGFFVYDPTGVLDKSQPALTLTLDYGHVLYQNARFQLYLLTPLWLQIKINGGTEDPFFGAGVGLQWDVVLHRLIALYARFHVGIGGGSLDAAPAPNETDGSVGRTLIGTLSNVSLGVKLRSQNLQLGLEPLSLSMLNPIRSGTTPAFLTMSFGVRLGIVF